MNYTLPTMTVYEECFAPVQSKILDAIHNGIGVARTIPTAIRHGPVSMGGLDLLDLRTEAGISAIQLFRESVFSMSETGKMILINIYHSQLESGRNTHLFERPDIAISYLTPTWPTSVCQYLFQHNLTITLTDAEMPHLQSKADQFIMTAQHLERFTAAQCYDINLVRLYLQASTLFDLLAGTDGKTICPDRLCCHRPPTFSVRPFWPRQEAPTLSQARLWTEYVTTSFIRYRFFWTTPLSPRVPLPTNPSSNPLVTPLSPNDYPSLPAVLKAIPPFYQRLLHHHVQIAMNQQVWRAFRSRSCLEIVTDGSLALAIGTFGWRLLRPPNLILFEGSDPIDGPFELSTSTRSELGGYAAPLLLVAAISRFWWGMLQRCKFRWIVDSTSAISKVQMLTRPGARPRCQPNNIDFLSLINFNAPLASPGSRAIKIPP